MASSLPASSSRRVLLVDPAPRDSQLVSELLQRPGITVGLVALPPAASDETPLPDLSGVPLTRDLADVTRQVFDLALVGTGTSRRTQIEQVLAITGTRVAALEEFLAIEMVSEWIEALRTDGALLGDMPPADDPAALELALARWLPLLGATSVELQGGDAGQLQWVCASGPPDPLLKHVSSLALEHRAPQVVSMPQGFDRGRVWGAWPFRTGLRSGVLAATGPDPGLRPREWEQLAQRLAEAWERQDRERAGASFPMTPGIAGGWLPADAFRHRLSLAVERNRRDGLRFAVHRLTLNGTPDAAATLSQSLPRKLRDTDCVCRPSADSILVLIAGPPHAAANVWKRIASLWEESWRAHGGAEPVPAMQVESAELLMPSEADHFLEVVTGWSSAA